MRARSILVLVAALGLSACGEATTSAGDFTGEDRAVAETVVELAESGQQREPEQICNQVLATALREEIAAAGSDCAEEMLKAIEDADAFDLEVTDVQVTGTTATAEVESTDGDETVTRTFELVRENDDWRIGSFGSG